MGGVKRLPEYRGKGQHHPGGKWGDSDGAKRKKERAESHSVRNRTYTACGPHHCRIRFHGNPLPSGWRIQKRRKGYGKKTARLTDGAPDLK